MKCSKTRIRKSSSCVKDKFRQLKLDKFFSVCTKSVKSESGRKIKNSKTLQCSRKLFVENVRVIVDDEEAVVPITQEVKYEVVTVQTECVSQSSNNRENSAASRPIDAVAEVPTGKRNMISLNKPVKEMRSPEKIKPRVLQSITLSQSSIVNETYTVVKQNSSSQCSFNSDDTVIYDPFDQNCADIASLSPSSKLVQKVNENVQATRFSSVAYRRRDHTFEEAGSSSTRKLNNDVIEEDENDLLNPRAVNFVTKIIKYVFTHPHFKNLFSEEELATFERFFCLPLPEYNYFCYKLFTRLPRWYNVFNLCKKIHLQMDTGQILNMHTCLGSNGFILTDYSMEPVEQLLNLLSVKEIREICDSFKLKFKNCSKSQLIDYLLQNCSKQTTLTLRKNSNQILRDRIREKLGNCVKLSEKLYDLLYRVHLLYALGSSEFSKPHDLYQFIDRIENMDIILPEYTVDTSPIFNSREEFIKFAKASEYKDELLNAFDSKNRDTMLEISRCVCKHLQEILNQGASVQTKPSYLLRFTAGAKYASALSIATKHLAVTCPNEVKEWLKLLLSQDLYCTNKRGFWHDQLVMIETKYLHNYEMGAQSIIAALEDNRLTQVALHDLSNRAVAMKNSKKYKLHRLHSDKISFLVTEPPDNIPFPSTVIDANAIQGNESGRKRTYIEKDIGSDVYLTNVEQIALNYYRRNGFPKGVHCEGSLLITFFFLLFWDIIYDNSVPSAFINEIQYIPSDLYGEDFYSNRKNSVDQRLAEIKATWPLDMLESSIRENWEKHAPKRSLIVNELVQNGEELIEIISCIGRECLALLLERLAKHFKQFHSGMPDLFVWSFEKKKCRFVEVKGEKDKLSTKQKLWLNYLRMAKADIQVCHVHTIGSKSTKKIAKLREEQNTDALD